MKEIVSTLRKLFKKDDLEERCGLILTDGTVVPTDNAHESPEEGFIVPAQELVRYEGKLYGTWHTHPKTVTNLSQVDYYGFLQWPDLVHFIMGVDGVRCFVVEDGLVVEKAID